MPVRYLAPETFKKGCFSSCSDVFSFGVYIWEVFQNVKTPWAQYDGSDGFKKVIYN